jgi:deoxyribose-phosphate aldolase
VPWRAKLERQTDSHKKRQRGQGRLRIVTGGALASETGRRTEHGTGADSASAAATVIFGAVPFMHPLPMAMATIERQRTLDTPQIDAVQHRNPGFPLELDWVRDVRVNRSAVERRAATIGTRRTVKKEWQAAWLLRAVTLMDLTTLSGDDTPGYVRRLCAKAARPVRQDLLTALGMSDVGVTVAAVCVYHQLVATAVDALAGTGIPVAAVSTGFPAGLSPFPQRLDEIRASVEAGADEIDVVITRAHVLNGAWEALYDEIRAFREACGAAHIKVILGTGELGTLRNIARASMVAMMAGADFIKTSTGKESVNAILPTGLVMTRMIREYHERTGHIVGFKPAGGIRTAKQSLEWMLLMKEELGTRWLTPGLFRFGASSLLADIERQLEHHVTGRYSAGYRHPTA